MMLEVDGLDAFYGEQQALFGIGFGLDEGHVRTLLGANGAGKTTVLRALCGMVRSERRDPFRRQADHRLGDRGHRPARRRPRARGARHVSCASRSRRTCSSAR